MTKEEALQKVTDYCTEKAYTNATLTDAFKDKFAEHFAKRYPNAAADDETAIADLKFSLNTAFSSASLIITDKSKEFESKENDYRKQIDELNKKLGTQTPTVPPTPPAPQIPKELQDKLDRLEKFENEARKNDKFKEVLGLAKQSVREDLHKSFEKFAEDWAINLNETSEEQAKKLTTRFQDIFKDSLGDIKPFAPRQTRKQEEEFLASLPKIKV